MSPLTLLTGNPIQSILGVFGVGGSAKSTSGNTSVATAPNAGAGMDSGQLSPFAQLMSTLQQVQQSSPSQYQQLTQQIAANLQSAAQTAQTQGNATAANSLNQLATDFTQASTSGQLPNAQDLAAAIGHHHGHHHGHHAASTTNTADSASATSGSAGSSVSITDITGTPASQNLSSLIAALQSNSAQNSSLNPMSIISSTLSGAGINI